MFQFADASYDFNGHDADPAPRDEDPDNWYVPWVYCKSLLLIGIGGEFYPYQVHEIFSRRLERYPSEDVQCFDSTELSSEKREEKIFYFNFEKSVTSDFFWDGFVTIPDFSLAAV